MLMTFSVEKYVCLDWIYKPYRRKVYSGNEIMEKQDSFANTYGINPIEYVEVEVECANFSMHTYRRLRNSGVNTVADLLRKNEVVLLSIKGFGRNSYDEVLRYIKFLRQSVNEDNLESKMIRRQPYWAREQKELLFEGRFDEINSDYLDKDRKYIESIKEAYEMLGEEIIKEIRKNSIVALEYERLFRDFYSKITKISKQRNEMKKCLDSLVALKPNKYVYPYIFAFPADTEVRNKLYSVCVNDECTFEDLLFINIDDYEIGLLFIKFLKWCRFDLSSEYEEYLNSLKDRGRVEDILMLRCHHSTLEEIGNIYGITRERIRQIEAMAVKKFKIWEKNHNFLAKVAAECGCCSVVPFKLIYDFLQDYSEIVIYMLRLVNSSQYYVDLGLKIIVRDDFDYSVRIQKYVDMLPEVFNVRELSLWMQELPEQIPEDVLVRAVELQYHLTGDTYHRSRLSVGLMCEHVLKMYYPNGLHIYDEQEIESFRNYIYQDYGDVKMSDTNRALVARISDVGVLCGRGRYKSKQDKYLSPILCENIRKYIDNSAESIFLINTLYAVFEDDLRDEGVDNKYYLQGILREIFGDRYYFRRDYLSKDANLTSIYSAIVSFIKKSSASVTKAEIFEAFQGLTEIVLNLATSDPEVLNYFGSYIHVDNIKLYDEDYAYVKEIAHKLLSKFDVLHSKDFFDYMNADNSEFIERTGAIYPYRLFSLLEYMLADEYQFARPYIARINTVIDRPMERFAELLDQHDITELDELLNLASECRFQMIALLDFLNMFSETHLILDKTHLIKISATGIDEMILRNVEALILNEIQGTKVISQLRCRELFPRVNIEWSEWIIYSAISKWSDLLEVGLTTRVFKDAVALVAPAGLLNPDEFSNVLATTKYQADNLDNIDDLIADIIEGEIEV